MLILNKVKDTKTQSSAISLLIVLMAGTFSAIFPFFIMEVEAQTALPSGDVLPMNMVYDPVNKRIYVTNIDDEIVSITDNNINRVVGHPIKVEDQPVGIAYDPVNKRMYVTHFGDGTVSVIDTTTLL